MAWIAIDAGTSLIKAVAFDRAGREINVARVKTEVLHPQPHFAEQSMTTVWAAVAHAVRTVAVSLDEPPEGLCTTAQGDGCWLVDSHLQPTGNALLWNDGRARAIVERWSSQGVIEAAYRLSGSVTYPGLANALLVWLAEHEPTRLQQSRWVLSCNGWLFAQLTGRIAADLSDASNPFSDIKAARYSDEISAAFGVQPLRFMLPEIACGEALCSPLAQPAADAMGLCAAIPVVMAPYDIVATAYGSGCTGAGQSCLILGTTICAETLIHELNLSTRPSGTTIALESGLYLRAMPTLTGCETLDWAMRMLGLENVEALEALAHQGAAGAGDLVFLPYLSEAGERSPFLESSASGSFYGLKLTHGPVEFARSVYEGLCFAVRECIETADTSAVEIRVCGGGARSSFWCQMVADVTGRTVLRPAATELGARGAFLFSRLITGEAPSLAAASAQCPTATEKFAPSASAGHYASAYPDFLRKREIIRTLWGPGPGNPAMDNRLMDEQEPA